MDQQAAIRFLMTLGVDYANTMPPAVKESVLLRIQAAGALFMPATPAEPTRASNPD